MDDCYDFVSWLPSEVTLRIFAFLPCELLAKCAQVNRRWFHAARDPELFRRLCLRPEWSPPASDKHSRLHFPLLRTPWYCDLPLHDGGNFGDQSAITPVNWREVFRRRSRLRRNWQSGRYRMRTFCGHSQTVYCIDYDGYRIVSGCADGTIRIWNTQTNAPWSAQTLRGHSEAVRCLQLLPLTSREVLGSAAQHATYIVDTDDQQDPNLANSCAKQSSVWQGPEVLLLSGGVDATVRLWHLSTSTNWSKVGCIQTLQGHGATVRCLQADADKIITGSYDCTMRWWTLVSQELVHVFRGHTAAVICLVYDDTNLYSGSLDDSVKIWSLESRNCLFNLARSIPPTVFSSTLSVSSLHLDRVRSRLLLAYHDGSIFTWNIPPADEYSPDEVVPRDYLLTDIFYTSRYSAKTGKDSVRCLNGDAWHIICGSDDKTLKVWRVDTDQFVTTLRGHEDGITCVLITASSVISGSYDNNVILYDFDVTL